MQRKKQATATSNTKSTTPSVLEAALKRFKDSQDYQKKHWFTKWDRDEKLYDGERYKASYEGVTDTFVPMVFPTIETMTSALSNANLRFDYRSGNPLHKGSAEPLNALVDEWWNEEQWDLATEEGSREFLKKGMCGFMWSWDRDRPQLDWFPMKDAIVDPTTKKPRQLQQPGAYAGRRYFVRKGALEDFEVVDTDEKSKTYGQLVKRYKPTQQQKDSDAPSDAELNDMYNGSTLSDASAQQDEIIEIWDVDRVVTVMNRQFVIEDVENPYKQRHEQVLRDRYLKELTADGMNEKELAAATHDATSRAKSEAKGVVPFFFFRNYRKIALLYADSETNSIAKEQERLNDLTNMEGDYIMKQVAAQRELDPQYEDFMDLINEDPGTVYPFTPGSLQPIVTPPLAPNAFNNRVEAKNVIREATAVDQIAKGGQSAPGTTATEVIEQQRSTGERIESKARILEKDGLYWMSWILFKLVQLYVDKPLVVEVSGTAATNTETTTLPNGVRVAVFDPADYQDEDWRPSITLELDSQNKKRKETSERRAEYQMLIQDPTNNLAELKKRYYPKMFPGMDKEDLDAITTPAAQDPKVGGGPTPPAGPEADLAAPNAMPPVPNEVAA